MALAGFTTEKSVPFENSETEKCLSLQWDMTMKTKKVASLIRIHHILISRIWTLNNK